jgi:hypothetical protein
MTVIYSHVIHSLRSTNLQAVPVAATSTQPAVPAITELESLISTILVPMLEQYHAELRNEISGQIKTAMQNSIRIQEMKPQIMERPRLRQLPTPVLTEGSSQSEEREARLIAAYRVLGREGIKPTGQTLSARARCNRAAALAWLKQSGMGGESGEIEEENREKQA